MQQVTNFDSHGLNQIFSTLSNSSTGFGTGRDKSKRLSINGTNTLTQRDLENLFRNSGLLKRLVTAYPIECRRDWMKIKQVRLDSEPEAPVEELFNYLDNLQFKEGQIGVKEAFSTASILARHHGDAFVILGIADGKEPDEPVDTNRIQSIEWLKVLNKYHIGPDMTTVKIDALTPTHYTIWSSDVERRWHSSRILRFSGNRLYDNTVLYNGGYNDSVIQSFFDTWSAWQSGLMASSAMLSDYDQGVYKFKGLGQALKEDIRAGKSDRQTQIQSRLFSAEMGRSVIKALLLDMDEEDFTYVSRNYGGASQIMELLKDSLIAESDLPSYKLFNTTNASGALSTAQTAGLAQRYDWASCKNNWMADNWVEPYTKLVRYAMFAKDSPLRGNNLNIEVIPNARVELTPLEKIEMQREVADRDATNINSGVYTASTAQEQYKQSDWDGSIILAEEDII